MMNQCSSNPDHHHHNNPMNPRSCDMFYHSSNVDHNNSFSTMFFNHPNNHHLSTKQYDDFDAYPTSSVVDCTLSLGTPSTRTNRDHHQTNQKRSSMSKLCSWDIFNHTKKQQQPNNNNNNITSGSGRGGGNNNNSSNNSDPLLARRCANCDTTSTPLWRNGPRGPKSLCNACGIRYKKEERRATSSSSTTTSSSTSSTTVAAASTVIDQQYKLMSHHNTWAHHQYPPPVVPQKEFMFVDHQDFSNDETAAAHGIPFLSWRLNVPDRSGLLHDYTC